MDRPHGSPTLGEDRLFDPERVAVALPVCAQRLNDAIDRLETGGPHLACRHVVGGEAEDVVGCVAHLAAGLTCHRCSIHHFRRHSSIFNKTCDECDAVVEIVQPFLYLLGVWHGIVVVDTQGQRRTLGGLASLTGFGVCRQCWDRLRVGSA